MNVPVTFKDGIEYAEPKFPTLDYIECPEEFKGETDWPKIKFITHFGVIFCYNDPFYLGRKEGEYLGLGDKCIWTYLNRENNSGCKPGLSCARFRVGDANTQAIYD